MNTLTQMTLVLVSTLTLAMAANAHDASMHVKKSTKADCSKVADNNMDMNDPVAIAMKNKCLKQADEHKKAMKSMDHSKMKMDEHKKAMKGMDHSKMKMDEHKAEQKDGQNEHEN